MWRSHHDRHCHWDPHNHHRSRHWMSECHSGDGAAGSSCNRGKEPGPQPQERHVAAAAESPKQQHWPLADVDANSSGSSNSSRARRSQVYDSIMAQWKKAASSTVPAPRSSHRRVLGGQALPTRQVGGRSSYLKRQGCFARRSMYP